jgi:hypothetical protein
LCCREANAGDLFGREGLAEKLKIRPDHICHVADVCQAVTLMFLCEIPYKTGVCKGKAPTVSDQLQSAARRYVSQGGLRTRNKLLATGEAKLNFYTGTIRFNGLHAQVQRASYL